MGAYSNTPSYTNDEKHSFEHIKDHKLSETESDSSAHHSHDGIFANAQWSETTRAYSRGLLRLRLSSITHYLRKISIFLLPSFIQPYFHGGSRTSKPKALYPTSYLDGMRGLGALFVFFDHYFYTTFEVAQGYSKIVISPPDSPTPGVQTVVYTSPWHLPFIKLLYAGPSMVCIFFVISGYALSMRPIQLITQRNPEALTKTLSSLVFRRIFRLYLPPIISTLICVLLLRAGFYEYTREYTMDRRFIRYIIEHHPPLLPTLSEQLRHWSTEMWNFLAVWTWDPAAGRVEYDVHLWTIPMEFRCSMVVFLLLIGTARLRRNAKFAVLAAVSWFTIRSNRWEMFLFIIGMVLAEWDVRRGAHEKWKNAVSGSLPHNDKTSVASEDGPTSFWTLATIPVLYLLSCPDAGADGVQGWIYLGSLIPEWFVEKYRWWQIIGACLFVFCAARSRGWQKFFELPPVQYIGSLSYAVYLCHGPVIHIAGFAVQRYFFLRTGTEDPGYQTGAILAAFVNIPLVIWVADIFWRAVDAPTVRFAKWLEAKMSID
ncbi:acyltransferase family-domain-containing protein [Xylariaceae sp. FL1019]|nr:acyltransferase family-domain-containing protein [Xylariaceae sp. FL1019]